MVLDLVTESGSEGLKTTDLQQRSAASLLTEILQQELTVQTLVMFKLFLGEKVVVPVQVYYLDICL